MCSQFEVKDVAWDANLGAEKLDIILLNHFADEFQEKHGIDIRAFPKAVAKLKRQVHLSRLIPSSAPVTHVYTSHSGMAGELLIFLPVHPVASACNMMMDRLERKRPTRGPSARNPERMPAGEENKGGAERQHRSAHQRRGAAQWH